MDYKKIEVKVNKLIDQFAIKSLPIDVIDIAKKLGISVKSQKLKSNVSGLLVIENNKPTIGFNSNHPNVRQRFTIAHEIGHYILHREAMKLFIEKTFPYSHTEKYSVAVYRKDKNDPNTNNPVLEKEANAFAAALLIPEDFVKEELTKFDFDLSDVENIALIKLSEKFDVSLQAMSFRLANLGLFQLQ